MLLSKTFKFDIRQHDRYVEKLAWATVDLSPTSVTLGVRYERSLDVLGYPCARRPQNPQVRSWIWVKARLRAHRVTFSAPFVHVTVHINQIGPEVEEA